MVDSGDGHGVGDDAFFAEVRRRHPDIDIVVLPQQSAPEPPPHVDLAVLAVVPERFDDELRALWHAVVRDRPVPRVESRWEHGDAAGSVVREATLAVEGVDPVAGANAVATARRQLGADGWHVVVPTRGMPRVLAGYERDGIRREVQLVLVEATGRLALSYRQGSYAVGHRTARELVGA